MNMISTDTEENCPTGEQLKYSESSELLSDGWGGLSTLEEAAGWTMDHSISTELLHAKHRLGTGCVHCLSIAIEKTLRWVSHEETYLAHS